MSDYIVTEYKRAEKGRAELVINGDISIWLYEKEARSLSLQEGDTISEEQYGHILHDIIGKRAVRRAMHLLERQERTERQLRDKLLQSRYPQEAVEDAVDYVKRFHYLDDERYARVFIRYHQDKKGRLRLAGDLARRGVSKDVIERCMEEEYLSDDREKIAGLLEKKHFMPDTADGKEYKRIFQFLLRRGFRSGDIRAVMDGDCNKYLT